jgi:transposase-like protein
MSRRCLPPEISQQVIWLYLRFTLSFRDVEDLLAARGSCGAVADVCWNLKVA